MPRPSKVHIHITAGWTDWKQPAAESWCPLCSLGGPTKTNQDDFWLLHQGAPFKKIHKGPQKAKTVLSMSASAQGLNRVHVRGLNAYIYLPAICYGHPRCLLLSIYVSVYSGPWLTMLEGGDEHTGERLSSQWCRVQSKKKNQNERSLIWRHSALMMRCLR